MQRLVKRLTPLMVTAAILGWCCWSQLQAPAPLLGGMPAPQPTQLDPQTLSPEISPANQRDPFQAVKPEPEEKPEEDPAEEEVAEQEPVEPPFDPRVVLDSLRLGATMVGTDRPVALINGRVYGEGELIELESHPDIRCRLQRVLANQVVVEVDKSSLKVTPASPTSARSELVPDRLDGHPFTPPLESAQAYSKLLQTLKTAAEELNLQVPPGLFDSEALEHE